MKRYQKQSIKLMWLVNLGLLFVFGYALKIFLTSNQREEPSTGQEIAHSANSNTGNVALSAQSDVNSTLILERNIFGKGGRAKPEVQKIPVENKHKAVESAMAQLGIKLLGTVAGDQALSFAVLKDSKTDKQDIYQEGDTIQGARLEKILANRVVVVFHGERLVLNVASTEGRAMSSRPTVTRAAKPPVPVSMQGRIKDVLMGASPSEFLVNRIASGNSVQRLAQGLRDLTLEANREGPAGLKVTGVAKSPVARMIGLRDGDVIRRINGLSVGSLTEAGQVLRNARNAGIADIKLTRGQKEKTLSLRPSIW